MSKEPASDKTPGNISSGQVWLSESRILGDSRRKKEMTKSQILQKKKDLRELMAHVKVILGDVRRKRNIALHQEGLLLCLLKQQRNDLKMISLEQKKKKKEAAGEL